jgi:hypothetical protein
MSDSDKPLSIRETPAPGPELLDWHCLPRNCGRNSREEGNVLRRYQRDIYQQT